MYTFFIPDSSENFDLNIHILKFLQTEKEWFYDDFNIKSAYGVPGCCIWNGNRILHGEKFVTPQKFKKNRADVYKLHGIGYRLIFTNFMMQEIHYLDTYANTLCRIFNEEGADVMISTPTMQKYLQEHYPNLRHNWSTTTDFGSPYDYEGQIAKINELSRETIVVLPYTLNNKFPLLKKLEHPENIEVLVDEKCIANCPRRREHEINNCLHNLFMLPPDKHNYCLMFPYTKYKGLRTEITPRKNLQKYTELGINLFKIEGRTNGVEELLGSYLSYFVKPQYYQQCIAKVSQIALEQFDYELKQEKIFVF